MVKELRKNGYESLKQWLDESTDNIYIGRGERVDGAGKSKWANPYPVSQNGKQGSLKLYRDYILRSPVLFNSLDELKNKNLACWCVPSDCHGHILEELSNMTSEQRDAERTKIMNQAPELPQSTPAKKPQAKKPSPKEKPDIWEKKLQQMKKDKKKREEQHIKQEEELVKNEKAKEEYKAKRELEKKEKLEAKIKEKEETKKIRTPEYAKAILKQVQPIPLKTTERIDEISDKLYDEIIKKLPDTEFDGKARKYSYAISKMALYGVTYPTSVTNDINGILRVLRSD
jgi:hypothetical protein